ncbi:hypothetical protein N8J89_25460 [Crossiella sp. CA-258035]|uniref:hypothetical protein n=1 Tax=Crossiella sp. CA-258035 TaxID=2981138 RepID=UPI0024BCAD9F|nr:hypothetical protein [Crossiella sp. CA-258035]WHT16475.1 hypothetical protein N8J89_25460 [Crossiella sp. CA-258035]
MRKTASAVAVALMAVTGGVLMAAPAQAAGSGIEGTAPSCVTLKQWRTGNTAHAKAVNTCSGTQRVRMIWAWAADGSCVSVPRGYEFTETRGAAAVPPRPKVSELRSC